MMIDKYMINGNKKIILTACLGQCVHVAGVYNFMNIAKQIGYTCKFLGPANNTINIINAIKIYKPYIVGLSYRLTSSTVRPLLIDFFKNYKKIKEKPNKLFFAGTPKVVKIAEEFKEFEELFIGGEPRFKIISLLGEEKNNAKKRLDIPMDLISRINWKKPFPLLRAHFGLPTLEETVKGIKKISKANVLDVISIAPDQNTQANYFHPKDQIEEVSGAGGVPIRSKKDFIKLHQARLTGNHPLLRIYAGTRDFIKLAKLYKNTIQNAWAAIPIFWFNQMDGRGPLTLKESINNI